MSVQLIQIEQWDYRRASRRSCRRQRQSLGAEDSEVRPENQTEDPNLIVDQKYKQPGGKNLDRGVPLFT